MADNKFLEKLRGGKTNLVEEQEKYQKELMELKFKLSSGQLKETHKIKDLRRSIAKLKTLERENDLEGTDESKIK
tara:strand:- start:1139 stop:1363 length:225 start_codon:yes stop_codon:yes gene_type:complete